MRRMALVLTLVIIAACGKKDEEAPPLDTVPAAEPAPVVDLASVAGMWNMQVMGATSDSVLTTYTLTATADTAGWTLKLPDRDAMTLTVTVSGDSIISDSPEYESVLQKGVRVHTSSVFRVRGDSMFGTTTARYRMTSGDSVVMLRAVGTRHAM